MVALLVVCGAVRLALVRHPVVQAEIELGDVDLHVSDEQDGAQHRLGQDVEDTVEDVFGIGGDDITALAHTPGDGVEDPENDEARGQDAVQPGNVAAQGRGVAPAGPDDVLQGEGQGDHGQGEVTPFVGGGDDGADVEQDDIDDVEQLGVQDGVPVDARGQEQVHDDHGAGEEPGGVSYRQRDPPVGDGAGAGTYQSK